MSAGFASLGRSADGPLHKSNFTPMRSGRPRWSPVGRRVERSGSPLVDWGSTSAREWRLRGQRSLEGISSGQPIVPRSTIGAIYLKRASNKLEAYYKTMAAQKKEVCNLLLPGSRKRISREGEHVCTKGKGEGRKKERGKGGRPSARLAGDRMAVRVLVRSPSWWVDSSAPLGRHHFRSRSARSFSRLVGTSRHSRPAHCWTSKTKRETPERRTSHSEDAR
jgi:hypothetical protein